MPLTAALALNLTGHLVGAALYAMLVALVVAPPRGAARPVQGPWWRQSIGLALLTGVLGLAWNLGALTTDLYTLSGIPPPAFVLAGAFAALGFLPAVVVYAVVRGGGRERHGLGFVAATAAIGLAGVAALRHVSAARRGLPVPDVTGLLWLTGGATALLVLLLLWTRARRRGGSLWVLGLAIFAVSGFHLTGHSGGETWWAALVGHHASLPLAVAILQQEYRFAFADVFLKRALAVMALACVMLGVWSIADGVLPLARVRLDDPLTFAALLALWLTTAVTYPTMRRLSSRIVDRWLLLRPDPGLQHGALVRRLAAAASERDVLDLLRSAVATALDARRVTVHEEAADQLAHNAPIVRVPFRAARGTGTEDAVAIRLPTARAPYVALTVGDLQHGRRVLSDDLDLLEAFAIATARRLDAMRDERRRLETAVREQEISRLAVEAELRAVRAQLHPHFLFNALNTIRYLIGVAPSRADTVLLQLTGVLRAVLRRSSVDFSTLGEEVELVRSYLAIEQARFESRLHLEITAPEALSGLTLPALLLQPLVENAVRHGIAPLRQGGVIRLSADADAAGGMVTIIVSDTGAGAHPDAFTREGGVGLASVKRRLALHYGSAADLRVESAPGIGTTVSISLPVHIDGRRVSATTAPRPAASAPDAPLPAHEAVALGADSGGAPP